MPSTIIGGRASVARWPLPTCQALTAIDFADDGPEPRPFLAKTVQVYVFPALSAETVIGLPLALVERFTPPFVEVQVAT